MNFCQFCFASRMYLYIHSLSFPFPKVKKFFGACILLHMHHYHEANANYSEHLPTENWILGFWNRILALQFVSQHVPETWPKFFFRWRVGKNIPQDFTHKSKLWDFSPVSFWCIWYVLADLFYSHIHKSWNKLKTEVFIFLIWYF